MDLQNRRRESREIALQILFQNEFLGLVDFRKNLEAFYESFPVSRETLSYTKELLTGIFDNLEAINANIRESSDNWSIERMPLVDVNILRIAIYEINFSNGSTPPVAALNEALEIAKKYGGTNSPSFINGVLDSLVKSLDRES